MAVDQELIQELKSEWEGAFKPIHEKFEEEAKARGEVTAETKQSLDRVNDRLDEIEVKFEKAALDTRRSDDEPSEESKAFGSWLRKGEVSEDERKALSISDDTAGGFLAPAEYQREILKGAVEFSPVRALARVTETIAQSVKIPKRTGSFSAAWVSSGGTRSETTGLSYGLEEIPTHEAYALVDVENQLLEDSAFNLEAELALEYEEQFGVAEGTAFVSGSAVGRPEGFLTNADVTDVTSTTNDVLDARDFALLLYSLKEPYHANSVFGLNRTTLRVARNLQDSNGQFVWQPTLGADTPASLIGRPYVLMADMADVANGAKVLVVADWKRAYRIVDRIGMAVQRDPYTQNTSGMTRFIARKRVGGQIVVAEACKILNIQ